MQAGVRRTGCKTRCLPAQDGGRAQSLQQLAAAPAAPPAPGSSDLIIQGLFQPVCQPYTQLPSASSMGALLQQQQQVPTPAPAPTHRHQQQHAWASVQLQERPRHAHRQAAGLAAQLRGCSELHQLQQLLAARVAPLPPSALALAMQQLQHIKQQQQQQQQQRAGLPQQRVADAVELQRQLAAQLAGALLQQLPQAPAEVLVAFLQAAAAGGLELPPAVLDELAAGLVNGALRSACQQRRQLQQPQRRRKQQEQRDSSSSASPVAHHSQAQQQQQAVQQPHIVAAAACVLSRLRVRQPALWDELASLAGEQLDELSPRDCVLLCWALAHGRQQQPCLFHALTSRLAPAARRLPPDTLSCLLWASARLGHYHHAWLGLLCGAATRSLERFSPRSLATAAWATAALRHYEPRLLSALRLAALASMAGFDARSLALLAWALGRFGLADAPLVAALAGRASALVPRFSMQGLAMVAWAAARMATEQQQQQQAGQGGSSGRRQRQQQQQQQQAGVRQLVSAICDAAVPLLPSAKPQEVCSLLWACASLQLRHTACLDAAAVRLAAAVDGCSPRDLAQGAWALAVLRHPPEQRSGRRLVLRALNTLHLFGPQALSNWAWAVASYGGRTPEGLPAAVGRQFQVLLPQLSPQGVATTLWALSRMDHVPAQVMHAASGPILARIACYNAQDLCNIALACCKAGYREQQLLEGLAGAAADAATATLTCSSSASWPPVRPAGDSGAASDDAANSLADAAALAASSGGVPLGLLQQQRPAAPHLHLDAAQSRAQSRALLTPQGVCNLVFAFSGLGWHAPVLMRRLAQLAMVQLQQGQLQPRHIAGLLQGFARLGEPVAPLLEALGCSVPPQQQQQRQRQQRQRQRQRQPWRHRLATWPADALALLVWSAAASGAHMAHGACVAAALERLQALGADGLSDKRRSQLHMALLLLASDWGLINWQPHAIAVASAATAATASGGVQASRGCSCCSPPGRAEPGVQLQLSHVPASQQQQQQHSNQPRQQQSVLPEGVSADVAASVLCGSLAHECATAWRQQAGASQPPRVQEEVAGCLRAMGVLPLLHHRVATPGGGAPRSVLHSLSVELALVLPGRAPVALELLPPASLSSSWPPRVLGVTALQHACLRAAGWEVVPLSTQVWAAAVEQGGQQRLLRHLLRL